MGHVLQHRLIEACLNGKVVVLAIPLQRRAGKAFLVARQDHGGFLFNFVMHNVSTFQSYFNGQAGEGF